MKLFRARRDFAFAHNIFTFAKLLYSPKKLAFTLHLLANFALTNFFPFACKTLTFPEKFCFHSQFWHSPQETLIRNFFFFHSLVKFHFNESYSQNSYYFTLNAKCLYWLKKLYVNLQDFYIHLQNFCISLKPLYLLWKWSLLDNLKFSVTLRKLCVHWQSFYILMQKIRIFVFAYQIFIFPQNISMNL